MTAESMPSAARVFAHRCLLALTTVSSAMLFGCGSDGGTGPGGGGPLPDSGVIVYSRDRNGAGQIAPVLAESASGFDENAVDSPSVANDPSRPNGDEFLLYYEADGSNGTVIGVVSSAEEDLVPLTIQRTQVVGLGAAAGPYAFAATDPTVLVDKRVPEATRRYKMWFEGRGGAGGATSTILYGTSADGITWSAFTPCTGLNASFASVRVADPSVALDGSVFKMWFEAVDSAPAGSDGPGSIGYAESADGVAWVVKDAAGNTGAAAGPVLAASSATFDGYSLNAPCVLLDSGSSAPYKLWYEAGDKGTDVQNTIGYATSNDGLNWARSTAPVFSPSSDLIVPLPFDSGDLEHPTAVLVASIPEGTDGHFLLWYSGDSEGGATPNRIGLATGYTP